MTLRKVTLNVEMKDQTIVNAGDSITSHKACKRFDNYINPD